MGNLRALWLVIPLVAGPTVSAAAGFGGYGEWRGQAQYLVERHGAQAPVFQDVTPLTIRIDPDGKLVGTSSGNGCRLLGLARPMSGNVMSVDVTFTGCSYEGLNRRLTGTVAHYPGDKRLDFNLHKVDAGIRPVTSFQVGGSLRP